MITESPSLNTLLRVRDANAADASTIGGFNRAMARETEGLELHPRTARDGAAAVIDDPILGFYLLAERGTRVAGALLVTYEWSDWRNARFWWIQSVYVCPPDRGVGVYRALHEEVRRRARNSGGVCGIRLYADVDNHGALAVYASLGMRTSGYRLLQEDL